MEPILSKGEGLGSLLDRALSLFQDRRSVVNLHLTRSGVLGGVSERTKNTHQKTKRRVTLQVAGPMTKERRVLCSAHQGGVGDL